MFKLKPGTGQIFAFLILFIVFASIAGVVYVAVSGQSKAPEAANDYAASGLRYEAPESCTATTARVRFRWNRAVMAGWSNAEDFNLSRNSNFSSFLISERKNGQNTITVDVPRDGVTYARIATLYNGNTWVFSDTRTINNLTCPVVVQPIPSCVYRGSRTMLPGEEASLDYRYTRAGGQFTLIPGATSETPAQLIGSTQDTMSGTSRILNFKFDNSLKPRAYEIIYLGGTAPYNPKCTLSSGTEITILNKCDVNKSGSVDNQDVVAFGENGLKYSVRFDINRNGYVNSGDQLQLNYYLNGKPSVCST